MRRLYVCNVSGGACVTKSIGHDARVQVRDEAVDAGRDLYAQDPAERR
jgi:hypothetical protein